MTDDPESSCVLGMEIMYQMDAPQQFNAESTYRCSSFRSFCRSVYPVIYIDYKLILLLTNRKRDTSGRSCSLHRWWPRWDSAYYSPRDRTPRSQDWLGSKYWPGQDWDLSYKTQCVPDVNHATSRYHFATRAIVSRSSSPRPNTPIMKPSCPKRPLS